MTLKKLILIEVIIALILTFAGCSNGEEVQSTGGGDKFETTETTEVEETISDDEAYTLGYVFGYNLGISNRTKDYDEPEYPDNEEYMRGLNEGYENGLNDYLNNYEDYDEEDFSDDEEG